MFVLVSVARVWVCGLVCMCVSAFVIVYVRMYVCACVCVCVRARARVCVCARARVHVCINTVCAGFPHSYTYTRTSGGRQLHKELSSRPVVEGGRTPNEERCAIHLCQSVCVIAAAVTAAAAAAAAAAATATRSAMSNVDRSSSSSGDRGNEADVEAVRLPRDFT